MKRHIGVATALVFVVFISQSWASRPVPIIAVGCIDSSGFRVETIDFRDGRDPIQSQGLLRTENWQGKPMNLSRFRGKKVQARGWLLPGDRFVVDIPDVTILGTCGASGGRPGDRQLEDVLDDL